MTDQIRSSYGPAEMQMERRCAADQETTYLCDAQIQAIEDHITRYIGPIEGVIHDDASDALHVDIICVNPTPERPCYTFITIGMSALPMHVPDPLQSEWRFAELMVCLPADWPIPDPERGETFTDAVFYWPISFMKTLARLPTAYRTWLCEGHSIPNYDPPRPFAGNTQLSGAVLIRPTENTGFCSLELDEGQKIHFWQIMPVYAEEMDFKLRHGFETLLQRFEKHEISPIVDPQRPNVCRKKLFGLF